MKTQKIIWTALPHGIQEARLKLSVFVSPRLWTNEKLPQPHLDQFPDFLTWPEKLRTLTFAVEFDDNSIMPATRMSPDPDTQLWRDLFKGVTFVRPYKFPDFRHRIIRTYPMRAVVAYLREVYRTIGENMPGSLPKLRAERDEDENTTLQKLIDELGDTLEQAEGRGRQLDGTLKHFKVLDPNEPYELSKIALDFFQVKRFYERPEMRDPYRSTPDERFAPPRPEIPEIDFHQMLTALGDHQVLLYRLGLVFDLDIPRPATPSSAIRVRPIWGADEPSAVFNEDWSPWTKYVLTDNRFMAQPRPGSEIQNGMLNLQGVNDISSHTTPVYYLVQVDPDGMALKAINVASNIDRLLPKIEAGEASPDTPDTAGLPALRSAGITLGRSGRAFTLRQHFVRMFASNRDLESNDSSRPVTLFADDLVRGYRVDVLDQGHWRSLCQRIGTYTFPDGESKPIPIPDGDEGYVKGASTTSKDDKDSDLYLHEAIFRWDGWSLCAQRPGKAIVEDRRIQEQDRVERIQRIPNRAATEFKLETHIAAQPGTLPRLRFGTVYQIRVRTVDLAGHGELLTSTDSSHASEEILYSRYEPVLPPTLMLRARLTPGESVERMVIRSNYNQTVEAYIGSTPVQAMLKDKEYTYSEMNERHFVPPKTSQLMAETHGLFDEYLGEGKNYDEGYNIALKEEGTLFDQEIVDVRTGNKIPIPDPASIEVIAPRLPSTVPPSSATPPGRYVIHKEEQLLVPYLPDPIARGTALRDIPNVTADATPELEKVISSTLGLRIIKVPFDLSWPDAKPFRIQIVERPGTVDGESGVETFDHPEDPPQWNSDQRILTVFLAKAEVARIQYSSYVGGEKDETGQSDLDLMGIWQWLQGSLRLEELQTYALAGAHWMVTPARELVVVHAVQQPLGVPTISELDATKQVGDTFATLHGTFLMSTKSTGKIDVLAEWTEWIDHPTDQEPKQTQIKAHVFDLNVREPRPTHRGTYTVDPYLKRLTEDELLIGLSPNHRHELGDTKYRLVQYHLQGTTRFREYFSPEIAQDPKQITREGPPYSSVLIKNSARPAAPRILYIIPTFGWEAKRSPDDPSNWTNFERTRIGGGLRVYLERPWYSSGDGELLGVVLWPSGEANLPEQLKPYVSHLGMDPLWSSTTPKTSLDLHALGGPLRRRTDMGLSVEEMSGEEVMVVGFEPEYSRERQLWFCDIQFNSVYVSSYYPFVRLALARYQPNSLSDCHLSRIVTADFAQLAPDRRLSINFDSEMDFSVEVSGPGPDNPNKNRMEITIERRDPMIPGELGWKRVAELLDQPNPYTLELTTNPMQWKATLQLPAFRGSEPFRLVVKEYESFEADSPVTAIERVVYTDVVEI